MRSDELREHKNRTLELWEKETKIFHTLDLHHVIQWVRITRTTVTEIFRKKILDVVITEYEGGEPLTRVSVSLFLSTLL